MQRTTGCRIQLILSALLLIAIAGFWVSSTRNPGLASRLQAQRPSAVRPLPAASAVNRSLRQRTGKAPLPTLQQRSGKALLPTLQQRSGKALLTSLQQRPGKELITTQVGNESISLSLLSETFLYLSMGSDQPTKFTYRRGCLNNSALLFLTFKTPISLEQKPNCNCSTVHYPGSTWSTGRNELLRQAFLLEAGQGWRYEFFIFTDNDIELVSRVPVQNKAAVLAGDQADLQFQALLVTHRALRSSVPFGLVPLPPLSQKPQTCARACFTDACLDAFHRTGVELLLPYISVLDPVSWYMSAYMVNVLAAAIAPDHCHIYRQLGVVMKNAVHATYPRNQGTFPTGTGWTSAREVVNWRLVGSRVPGFSVREPLLPKIQAGLFGMLVSGTEEKCRIQPEGVDYTELVPRLTF